MKKIFLLTTFVLTVLAKPGIQSVHAQENIAPGTITAFAKKSPSSDFQNWIFALGTMVSVTAGILLTSWDPGAKAQNHH